MKRFLIYIFVVALAITGLKAQKKYRFRLGLGGSYGTMSFKEAENAYSPNRRFGWLINAGFEYKFNKTFAVNTGLNYRVNKAAGQLKLKDELISEKRFRREVLAVPLNLGIYIRVGRTQRLNIEAGPYVGYVFSGKAWTENFGNKLKINNGNNEDLELDCFDTELKAYQMSRLEAGWGASIALEFHDGFYLRFGTNNSLTNYFKDSNYASSKGQQYYLTVGFSKLDVFRRLIRW